MIEFRVGMQPGNNYRVAAALVGDEGDFASLQVANPGASFYVPSGDGQISFGGIGALSPMLTVWRKLHLEFDAMYNGPVGNLDQIEGTVTSRAPTADGFRLTLNVAYSSRAFNEFKNGRLKIPGETEFDSDGLPTFQITTFFPGTTYIHETVEHVLQYAYVDVHTDPGVDVVGKTIKIFDDDELGLATAGLPSPLLNDPDGAAIIENLRPIFSPAYIQLVNAQTMGLNPNKNILFINHLSTLTSVINSAKDLTDAPGFWAHTIVFAYQPSETLDGDPNPLAEALLLGATPVLNIVYSRFGYSIIFMESIRERAFLGVHAMPVVPQREAWTAHSEHLKSEYFGFLYGTIAHEIGHGPGTQTESTDHSEGGLMDDDINIYEAGTVFKPPTLRRFRSAESWRGH